MSRAPVDGVPSSPTGGIRFNKVKGRVKDLTDQVEEDEERRATSSSDEDARRALGSSGTNGAALLPEPAVVAPSGPINQTRLPGEQPVDDFDNSPPPLLPAKSPLALNVDRWMLVRPNPRATLSPRIRVEEQPNGLQLVREIATPPAVMLGGAKFHCINLLPFSCAVRFYLPVTKEGGQGSKSPDRGGLFERLAASGYGRGTMVRGAGTSHGVQGASVVGDVGELGGAMRLTNVEVGGAGAATRRPGLAGTGSVGAGGGDHAPLQQNEKDPAEGTTDREEENARKAAQVADILLVEPASSASAWTALDTGILPTLADSLDCRLLFSESQADELLPEWHNLVEVSAALAVQDMGGDRRSSSSSAAEAQRAADEHQFPGFGVTAVGAAVDPARARVTVDTNAPPVGTSSSSSGTGSERSGSAGPRGGSAAGPPPPPDVAASKRAGTRRVGERNVQKEERKRTTIVRSSGHSQHFAGAGERYSISQRGDSIFSDASIFEQEHDAERVSVVDPRISTAPTPVVAPRDSQEEALPRKSSGEPDLPVLQRRPRLSLFQNGGIEFGASAALDHVTFVARMVSPDPSYKLLTFTTSVTLHNLTCVPFKVRMNGSTTSLDNLVSKRVFLVQDMQREARMVANMQERADETSAQDRVLDAGERLIAFHGMDSGSGSGGEVHYPAQSFYEKHSEIDLDVAQQAERDHQPKELFLPQEFMSVVSNHIELSPFDFAWTPQLNLAVPDAPWCLGVLSLPKNSEDSALNANAPKFNFLLVCEPVPSGPPSNRRLREVHIVPPLVLENALPCKMEFVIEVLDTKVTPPRRKMTVVAKVEPLTYFHCYEFDPRAKVGYWIILVVGDYMRVL